jgi:hypothetical protein
MAHVSSTLEEFAGSLIVVDLLPQEHRAALDKSLCALPTWRRVSLNERSGAAGGHASLDTSCKPVRRVPTSIVR